MKLPEPNPLPENVLGEFVKDDGKFEKSCEDENGIDDEDSSDDDVMSMAPRMLLGSLVVVVGGEASRERSSQ